MTNEVKYYFGTTKTLEANGGSIASGAVAQANDATYSPSADGGNYPDADFVAAVTFGTAPTEGTALSLYARPLNVDGTGDAEAPEATRPTIFVGNFNGVNNVTTLQYLVCSAYDVPAYECEYWLHNNNTGQTISAGWTLKVTPKSKGPA